MDKAAILYGRFRDMQVNGPNLSSELWIFVPVPSVVEQERGRKEEIKKGTLGVAA